ncbi:MAG: aminotransferase class I/II-fold pyridoxal phosphate-dependent enzyme [Mobilitalea sp.]
MNKKRIYLSSPHMSEEGFENFYVQEAFTSNWIAPLGNNVVQFEHELCQMVGIPFASALSSGTAAIHMALKAAGVEAGDYVLCQSLTFSATANPIIYQNAIPVFIDSDEDTWNMSPQALEDALTSYEKKGILPRAVIVVHLYGLAADMDQIQAICKSRGITLIEDAAESLGSVYKSKMTGTMGDYGIYSFNGNKIITSSGGGMLVSAKEERIKKVKFWATQSRDAQKYYQHSELGYNYRMSNVLAGIGRGQLKVLPKRIEQKRHIFEHYKEELAAIKDITFMPINTWNRPNYWLSCIRLRGELKPQEVILALEKENIEARHIWKPMHLQPFFKEYDYFGGHVAEQIFTDGVCLPSDTNMTLEDMQLVTDTIKKLWS